MYLEKAHVKVIGTKYEHGPNRKEKKGATLSEFKFDDGFWPGCLDDFERFFPPIPP